MTAKAKTRQFTTEPGEAMRDRVIAEPNALSEVEPGREEALAAASQRFAAALRTAPADETMGPCLRALGKRPLWTTTFESDWHRYITKLINRSTIH